MMELRSHQKRVKARARAIATGKEDDPRIFLHAIPGAGKSLCVPIFANELEKATDQRVPVIWAAPRLSLQYQASGTMEEGFGRGEWQIADRLGLRGKHGFATNYQAISCNVAATVDAIEKMDGCPLLVADEIHHLTDATRWAEDSIQAQPAWTESFEAVYRAVEKKGGHFLFMSGTPYRQNRMPIWGAPYKTPEKDPRKRARAESLVKYLDMDYDNYVLYGRETAIKEQALCRVKWYAFDGETQYVTDGGRMSERLRLSELPANGQARYLKAFLHEDSFEQCSKPILEAALDHWLSYRRKEPGQNQAQLLVTAANQKAARVIHSWLIGQGVNAGIAISDEPKSLAAIRAFREVEFDALVTVAMAYEGMDAPRCTHLVHLGGYRSVPWLTQCIARVWRAGRPMKPFCALFTPADPLMVQAIESIRNLDRWWSRHLDTSLPEPTAVEDLLGERPDAETMLTKQPIASVFEPVDCGGDISTGDPVVF